MCNTSTYQGVGGGGLLLPQVGRRQALDAQYLRRPQQRGQRAVGHLANTPDGGISQTYLLSMRECTKSTPLAFQHGPG